MERCDNCGREFETEKGLSIHKTAAHVDNSWRDEKTLREMYYEKKMTTEEIGDEVGVSGTAVRKAMRDFGIEMKKSEEWFEGKRSKTAIYKEGTRGRCNYPHWQSSNGDETNRMLVHRLLAVSIYGADKVADNIVHHKNGIPWDNRPENLEIMEKTEHDSLHAQERGFGTEITPNSYENQYTVDQDGS